MDNALRWSVAVFGGPLTMAFDIDSLVEFSIAAVREFAANHRHEVFYAFAIDAALLCLNSEEAADRTLREYRDSWERQTRSVGRWEDLTAEDLNESAFLLSLHGVDRSDTGAYLGVINQSRARQRQRGNPYLEPDEIRALHENSGDWDYQGFARLTDENGFDAAAYQEHCAMAYAEQSVSPYSRAMDELIRRLELANAFSVLRRTSDFRARRVEHTC
jgi:hypothetical protein